jgi:YD repeat-containing protein
MSADGTTGGLQRTTTDGAKTYTRATVNTNATSTTVTDEKGNQSVYEFTSAATPGTGDSYYYETHRQIYQGSGGTPLMEQFTCYNGAQPNCDGASFTLPIGQTTVVNSYNGGSQLTTNNAYDAYGMLTSSTQQSGTTALAQTSNVYNSFEELLSTLTVAGSGNTDQNDMWAASYQYDAKGNQTLYQVQPAINTTTTYNATGSPLTVTTPNGTTQYGYDSTQTFVTSTTLPTPSSGVSLASSASYDPHSGAQLSATGLNGQTTQVTQYDPLLRPAVTTLPNGGQITNTYSPNQIGVTQPTGEGTTADTETLLDAYGRKSRVAVANGQAGNSWYQTDYCYDATGLLQFQSVQYQGNGWGTPKQCSGAGTSHTYDALGRLTTKTTPDGTSSTQYQGRAVEATSVAGAQKITQYDMLGRISAVCEISSNGSMPASGAPVACGTDIAGTGFLTSYSYAYSLLSTTTTITQGAQQRVVQTDSAGRIISTSEPERGTTTYSYANNGTGLVLTRQRPQANQTNPSVLTTTTTQYDSLGRVVSISYSDGTPTKTFAYDTGAGWAESQSNCIRLGSGNHI